MTDRLRVLVLATEDRWSATAMILAAVAHALSTRGHVVALCCAAGGPVAHRVRERWPRVTVRHVRTDGFWRRVSTVRDVAQALRPDVMLVGSDDDAAAAALAMRTRGGVVQRVPLPPDPAERVEESAAPGWRHRVAISRGRVLRWGPALSTVILPSVAPDISDRHPRLPLAVPHVALLVPHTPDAATVAALRTLGALHERHPDLRVTLVGESGDTLRRPTLQSTRVQAAAVGLTEAIDVLSLDQWLDGQGGATAVCWCVIGGDAGALAALAAMQRGVPVVVHPGGALASLVVPPATGLHAPAALPDLARLIGDSAWQGGMSRAAQSRVQRHFASETAVLALEEHLVRVAAPASPVSRSSTMVSS